MKMRCLKEELKLRDEQLVEQQRTFEQRCEERIQQQIAEQMRLLMEQVARFTGAPVTFTRSPSRSAVARLCFVGLLVMSTDL